MPSTKSGNRRGPEPDQKNRRGRLSQKSSSFHGGIPTATAVMYEGELRRPKTLPELFSGGRNITVEARPLSEARPKLTKLLLNVMIQGSVGPVQVVMSPERTVGDLIASAIRQYVKDGRRPILPTMDPSRFDLHYSQFSLESLERDEKLTELGSRNFFLCLRKMEMDGCGGGKSVTTSSSSSSCSKEAEKVTKSGFTWLKFMDFLL